MNCNICNNSENIEKKYIKNNYNILYCKKCDLLFTEWNGSGKELETLYAEDFFKNIDSEDGFNDYFKLEHPFRLNAIKRIKFIKHFFKNSDKCSLLDIGCSTGFFMDEAKAYFSSVAGIEISDYAAKYGREKLGLNILTGTKPEKLFPQNSFDIITMWDTIEHLPDPITYMKNIRSLLKDGGMIFLTTGDKNALFSKIQKENWHLLTPPEHLFFFSPTSLDNLFEKVKLKAVDYKYPWTSYTIGYAIERIEKNKMPFHKFLSKLKRFDKLTSLSVPLNLFDVMLVSIKKD